MNSNDWFPQESQDIQVDSESGHENWRYQVWPVQYVDLRYLKALFQLPSDEALFH